MKPFVLDFLQGKIHYRRIKASANKELLGKAIGITKQKNKVVFDLTAGWGNDAFIMACLGAKVTMIERSPIIGALLKDAWQRAQQDAFVKQLTWQFLQIDSFDFLQQLEHKDYPHVIYLDPMFPERKKSAMVKKEMQLLQQIIGTESDSAALFELALKKAKERVVVKRPRLAEPLIANKQRDLILLGKAMRFDIYFINKVNEKT